MIGEPLNEVRVQGEGTFSEPTRQELVLLCLFSGGLAGFIAGAALVAAIAWRLG